jgi:hypothetical protein
MKRTLVGSAFALAISLAATAPAAAAEPTASGPAARSNGAGVALALAAESPDDVSVARLWSRCNNIAGSPLCITVNGSLNNTANVTVSYRKNSGPVRSIRLYVSACRTPRQLVYQGSIAPGQTRYGSKVRHIYFNSCWVGHMRIGNTQWTTGELLTR